MAAAGITAGDEVIVPNFTFVATASAVLFARLHNVPEAERSRRLLADMTLDVGNPSAPAIPAT